MVTANDVVPPRCMDCDKPLTTTKELNQRIDFGIDLCEACEAESEANECWCSYGFFHGGDPRLFVPDDEMNTPDEIAAWQDACAAWDRGAQAEPAPEEHGPWVNQETGAVTLGERPPGVVVGVCHAFRSFGMGSTYCEQHRPSRAATSAAPEEPAP